MFKKMKYPDVIITKDYKTWKKMKCGNYQCHGLMKTYEEVHKNKIEEFDTFETYYQEQRRIAMFNIWEN